MLRIHVLQPLDLRLFSSFKRNWRQAVRDWQAENVGKFVTKVTFARVFKQAWKKSTTVDVAVKGFQESGLFPLNMNVVIKSVKLEPSQLFSKANKELKQIETSPEQSKEVSDQSQDDDMQEKEKTSVNQDKDQQEETPRQLDLFSETPPKPEKQNNKLNTALDQSPFSKHLQVPTPKSSVKSKAVRQIAIPKAITGAAYRKIMEERRARKEEEELAKEKRKADRLEKKKLRDEEKLKKRAELDAKRRKKAEEKQKKAETREQLLKSLEESEGSDGDDAQTIEKEQCLTHQITLHVVTATGGFISIV